MYQQRTCAAASLLIATLLAPVGAVAEPAKLKLAFYSSDQSMIYRAAVKPFVDAVNADGRGVVEIAVFPAGALGKDLPQQHMLVIDGAADLAFLVPGMAPGQFVDNAAIELPGLFQNIREATLAYTRLASGGVLRGYEDLIVLGAYGTEPEAFHVRPKVTGLSDLAGLKIRTNNPMEGLFLQKIGAEPVPMGVNVTAEAISKGTVSGALIAAPMLYDMGIARVTTYHYFLKTSTAPLALVMSKRVFNELPPPARDVIKKYAGSWAAARFIEIFEALGSQALNQLDADPRRTILYPSTQDQERANKAFSEVADEFAGKAAKNRELVALLKKELTAVRSGQ